MINKSDLPKFDPDVYTKITLNDLVVYSIYYLHNKNAEVMSEDIISACFMLFPKRFFLRNHPHWPDSAMVSRHWNVCRSKGYIAAATEPGFKLTAKGIRLAEKVAKTLGVAMPQQTAKIQPVRTEKVTPPVPTKKARPVRAQKVSSVKKGKTGEIEQKKKAVLQPAIGKTRSPQSMARAVTQTTEAQPVHEKKAVPPAPTKKIRPARANKVAPVKKGELVEIAQKEKVILPPAARKTQSPRPKTHTAKPIKNVRPTWTKKIKSPEPVVRPIVVKKASQPEKAIQPAQSIVTPEVKVRAGKFVHLMERSDAYIHYKKNGKNSKISEFDFRSLLLCTMESSPETLARNVEQFKGYAVVHNRHDLVAFLDFCKEKLSYLLAAQTRQSTRRATK